MMKYRKRNWILLYIFLVITFCRNLVWGVDFQFKEEITPYLRALNSIECQNRKYSLNQVAYLLVAKIRDQGVLVDGFSIQQEDLKMVSVPFLAYLQDRGWVIVEQVPSDDSQDVILTEKSGEEETIGYDHFLSQWNGCVISKVITNTFCYKIPLQPSTTNVSSKVVIVYLNHDKFTNLAKIKKLLITLEKELDDARGARLVYLDELGLIPEESIENMAKLRKRGRKEIFQEFKNLFQQELDEIQKGIPIYDQNIFYRELYKFLAQRKAKCFIEDLDYKLWEFIVGFDSLKILNTALFYFTLGNFQKATETLQVYQDGYSTYNIELRDANFVSQLLNLRKRFPESVIFTVRGLAHYGLEKELIKRGENVEILIMGNQEFLENFTFQQRYSLFKRNNVKIDGEEAALLLLKTVPQEVLRVYLDKFCRDINLVTKSSIEIVERLSLGDFKKLADTWKRYFVTEGYKNRNLLKLAQVTYKWLEKNGFIKEEEKSILFHSD